MLGLMLCACDRVGEADMNIQMPPVALDRTLLLMEFTGLQCVNCPLAAEEAHRLLGTYPNNLIVVEMHPKANPFTNAKAEYDYTCEAADRYYAQFGGTASTPFPTGVIAFQELDGKYFQSYTNWEKYLLSVTAQLSQDPIAETRYWVVEDHVTGPQLMPDGKWNYSYEHNHLLRAEISEEEAKTWPEKVNELAPNVKDVANTYIVAVSLDSKGRFVNAEKK